ncbi:glutamine synthetase beta-grasp domain-containing protein [Nocardioides sp.]|uniref:glutamine synthetase beta-grasp domain-containing protein n=1 Tax=Nocardioides sp. TaxID=35761 RepID=UPI0026377FA1|nr:glutamine synthetase family protein [Nocardioides sp.]
MTEAPWTPHPIERVLGKARSDLSWEDLVEAVERLGLEQVDLRYVGGDGRLKSIAFPIGSREQLVAVLVRGERVDGSSVFGGASTEDSDVYVVPRWSTAFVNPFGTRPSLDLLCSFYDSDGEPLAHAQDQVVRRAAEELTAETGLVLEAFGELEYYLVSEPDPLYAVEPERGYQESPPFSKYRQVREEVLRHLASFGIATKYVHGEVGSAVEGGRQLVQHEIELLPVPVPEAADALVITKWLVREVAHAHGLEATFAPSVTADGAGNGLHVHSRLVRPADGRSGGEPVNVIVDNEGLTDTGKRLVAGYLGAARALSAFGNTVPTSYLRLEEGDESPEGICWGETDRTGLVRVPLAWVGDVLPGMVAHANPGTGGALPDLGVHPQTVELRLGDGSADVHLLLAGMALAARRGLTDPDSLAQAERLRADGDDGDVAGDPEQLPTSCAESADALEEDRALFEADGVFPGRLVDETIEQLRERHAATRGRRTRKDASAREELVRRYWHVG